MTEEVDRDAPSSSEEEEYKLDLKGACGPVKCNDGRKRLDCADDECKVVCEPKLGKGKDCAAKCVNVTQPALRKVACNYDSKMQKILVELKEENEGWATFLTKRGFPSDVAALETSGAEKVGMAWMRRYAIIHKMLGSLHKLLKDHGGMVAYLRYLRVFATDLQKQFAEEDALRESFYKAWLSDATEMLKCIGDDSTAGDALSDAVDLVKSLADRKCLDRWSVVMQALTGWQLDFNTVDSVKSWAEKGADARKTLLSAAPHRIEIKASRMRAPLLEDDFGDAMLGIKDGTQVDPCEPEIGGGPLGDALRAIVAEKRYTLDEFTALGADTRGSIATYYTLVMKANWSDGDDATSIPGATLREELNRANVESKPTYTKIAEATKQIGNTTDLNKDKVKDILKEVFTEEFANEVVGGIADGDVEADAVIEQVSDKAIEKMIEDYA
jgi:hypothetical protein